MANVKNEMIINQLVAKVNACISVPYSCSTNMLKKLLLLLCLISGSTYIVLYWLGTAGYRSPRKAVLHKISEYGTTSYHFSQKISSYKVSDNHQNIPKFNASILFVETTDTWIPSLSATCAVESAARIYHDKQVWFFMKGLTQKKQQEQISQSPRLFLLSQIKNVFISPLNVTELLLNTPLLPWYQKVNPSKEKYWTYVTSDAFRFALIWKYGGIYLDTDVISVNPVLEKNFLVGVPPQRISSAAFGFHRHYHFLWDCMKHFVSNYHGSIWGYQGPSLLTRMLKQKCQIPAFQALQDDKCQNISLLHPTRFYPITYPGWKIFYQPFENFPNFNNSYGVHLWNYMNKENRTVVTGSNTLIENIYKKYCPDTYKNIVLNSLPKLKRKDSKLIQ
ncbi:alpha-1,4-N-acetylglucosaminyltransferase-like [Protopterus annectens]|uniref:alpha-1,4-N-acetylglucosaminyltransferase-like n=1 Tax=Protopterus annectens TaxID=7888 RepID=UPI001CFB1318|nr:alpha-1,4-N-acetylglucosaminyltransferase-like [Protopterus annectens]